jgi:hypothetical protein
MDGRIPLSPPWVASGNEAYLTTATRLIDNSLNPSLKTLIRGADGVAYYRISRQWTGAPATATQRLAWPRIGMVDVNGFAIAPTVIPQDLKDAVSEFAGQLLGGDRSLDNSVIVQGISSIKAGSVALSFNKELMPQVLPDAVLNMMPSSWFTDELYVPANAAIFDVVSADPNDPQAPSTGWW